MQKHFLRRAYEFEGGVYIKVTLSSDIALYVINKLSATCLQTPIYLINNYNTMDKVTSLDSEYFRADHPTDTNGHSGLKVSSMAKCGPPPSLPRTLQLAEPED